MTLQDLKKITLGDYDHRRKYYYFPDEIKKEIRAKLPDGYSLSTNPVESVVICTEDKTSDGTSLNFDERIIEWLYRDYKLHVNAAFTYYGSICVAFQPRSKMK